MGTPGAPDTVKYDTFGARAHFHKKTHTRIGPGVVSALLGGKKRKHATGNSNFPEGFCHFSQNCCFYFVFFKASCTPHKTRRKTSLTERKTSKTLRKIEIFGEPCVFLLGLGAFWWCMDKRFLRTPQNPKISIFPRVFEVFRLVRDVFPVCLVRGARRFEKTPIFRKLTKTHRKIAISSRLLPFFDGGSAPDT